MTDEPNLFPEFDDEARLAEERASAEKLVIASAERVIAKADRDRKFEESAAFIIAEMNRLGVHTVGEMVERWRAGE